jgi:hydroxyethylthiazole kinase-like uncharacterized protein yjeF
MMMLSKHQMPSKAKNQGSLRRKPGIEDHKYSRGVVAVVAGSAKYPGAAVLAVGGARRGGVGYVKYFSKSPELTKNVIIHYPDVAPINDLSGERIDALVVGPGAITLKKLPTTLPVVLDGAAISLALNHRGLKNGRQIMVLTPHEGELKQLGYELATSTKFHERNRLEVAQKIADKLNVILVLKGKRTIIAAPNLKPIIDSLGGVELATAGSGDILAGLIGAFLASWKPDDFPGAQKVVASAIKLHSKAGKHAARRVSNVVATDLLESLAHC